MRRKEILSSNAISSLRQRRELDACSSCKTPSSIWWRAKLFLTTTTQDISQHLHLTDEKTESQRGYDLSLVKRSLSPLLINQVAKDQKESWTHSVKGSSCGVSKAGLWSPSPARPLPRCVTWTSCSASRFLIRNIDKNSISLADWLYVMTNIWMRVTES